MSVIDSESVLEEQPSGTADAPVGRFARQQAWLRKADASLPRFGVHDDEKLSLGLWLLSRFGIALIVWITVWTNTSLKEKHQHSISQAFQRWDVLRYITIAKDGYSVAHRHGSSIAFFPGMPGALVAVNFVIRSYWISGVLISFVAGGIASMALARIIAYEAGTDERDADKPLFRRAAVRNGITLWLCSPAAMFLAVGYTESLFLAFALPAWLAARKQRWLLAGLLTAGATTTRINGVFLVLAFVVMFALTRPRGLREWLRGSPILIGFVPLILFFGYLYHLTHDWLAWTHAEAQGWDRKTTNPWRTFKNTWHYGFGHVLPAAQAWEYQIEILATAVGLGLTVWLLLKRRWPEATYVGVSAVSLATSHVYMSVTRELLVWFPLWAILGVWTVRRPLAKTVILTVTTPMMFIVAYLFFSNRWAG